MVIFNQILAYTSLVYSIDIKIFCLKQTKFLKNNKKTTTNKQTNKKASYCDQEQTSFQPSAISLGFYVRVCVCVCVWKTFAL